LLSPIYYRKEDPCTLYFGNYITLSAAEKEDYCIQVQNLDIVIVFFMMEYNTPLFIHQFYMQISPNNQMLWVLARDFSLEMYLKVLFALGIYSNFRPPQMQIGYAAVNLAGGFGLLQVYFGALCLWGRDGNAAREKSRKTDSLLQKTSPNKQSSFAKPAGHVRPQQTQRY